jgi:hypothetical protein
MSEEDSNPAKEVYESIDPDHRESIEKGINKVEKDDEVFQLIDNILHRHLKDINRKTLEEIVKVFENKIDPNIADLAQIFLLNHSYDYLGQLMLGEFDAPEEVYYDFNELTMIYGTDLDKAQMLNDDPDSFYNIKTTPKGVSAPKEPSISVDMLKANGEEMNFTVNVRSLPLILNALVEGLNDVERQFDGDALEAVPDQQIDEIIEKLEEVKESGPEAEENEE